jgi:hypothetical protein
VRKRIDLRCIGDVRGHAERFSTQTARHLDRFGEAFHIDIGEYELHAQRRALQCELAAEAAAGARDYGHFAVELVQFVSF